MLTVGSLFAGIGGIELGLEQTGGFKTIWSVELDEFCNAVRKRHWPDVPQFRDVREFPPATGIERPDVICGGFPCQPHSLAGKRKAGADDRDLWPEFARILGELRPPYALLENVPGLFTSDDGRFFGRVLGDLAEIGYGAEWRTLRASDFGFPHRRERVFIVCHAGGQGLSRFVENNRIPIGARKTLAVLGNTTFESWIKLEGNRRCLRNRNGFSVTMERRRLSALGNAVVPACARYIGERILDFERNA